MDGTAHQQHNLAAIFKPEERGDIIRSQGIGQAIISLDRIAQQRAPVTQEIPFIRVTQGDIIVPEDPADDVVEDFRIR